MFSTISRQRVFIVTQNTSTWIFSSKSCSFWNSARRFRSSFANSRKVVVYYSYGYSWYNDNVLIACLFHVVENWSILNETVYIQGVSKMLEIRKLEILEIILSNIFLCENFRYGFVTELLTKKHWPIIKRVA